MILSGKLTIEWSQLIIFLKKTTIIPRHDPPRETYARMISANDLPKED
jgi:hypothetical protein